MGVAGRHQRAPDKGRPAPWGQRLWHPAWHEAPAGPQPSFDIGLWTFLDPSVCMGSRYLSSISLGYLSQSHRVEGKNTAISVTAPCLSLHLPPPPDPRVTEVAWVLLPIHIGQPRTHRHTQHSTEVHTPYSRTHTPTRAHAHTAQPCAHMHTSLTHIHTPNHVLTHTASLVHTHTAQPHTHTPPNHTYTPTCTHTPHHSLVENQREENEPGNEGRFHPSQPEGSGPSFFIWGAGGGSREKLQNQMPS